MKNLLAIILALFVASMSVFAQPKLEMENGDEYNWGDVKPSDSPLKAKVKIYNKGDQDLHITNVRPGCGCTTAPLDKKVVPPNDFATLDITLNVGTGTDNIIKSILIESTDPSRKSFNYYIKANVKRPIAAFPQYFVFNELYFNTEASSKVILKNTTDKEIKILNVKVSPESAKVNLKKDDILPPQKEITLEAIFTPLVMGANNIRVAITTDHPDTPLLELNGWGNAIEAAKAETKK